MSINKSGNLLYYKFKKLFKNEEFPVSEQRQLHRNNLYTSDSPRDNNTEIYIHPSSTFIINEQNQIIPDRIELYGDNPHTRSGKVIYQRQDDGRYKRFYTNDNLDKDIKEDPKTFKFNLNSKQFEDMSTARIYRSPVDAYTDLTKPLKKPIGISQDLRDFYDIL